MVVSQKKMKNQLKSLEQQKTITNAKLLSLSKAVFNCKQDFVALREDTKRELVDLASFGSDTVMKLKVMH